MCLKRTILRYRVGVVRIIGLSKKGTLPIMAILLFCIISIQGSNTITDIGSAIRLIRPYHQSNLMMHIQSSVSGMINKLVSCYLMNRFQELFLNKTYISEVFSSVSIETISSHV